MGKSVNIQIDVLEKAISDLFAQEGDLIQLIGKVDRLPSSERGGQESTGNTADQMTLFAKEVYLSVNHMKNLVISTRVFLEKARKEFVAMDYGLAQSYEGE